jgi:hypothetical protein
MSERTFRAVVASVLVGALALAVIVATVAFLPRSPEPSPSASVVTSAAPGPTRTLAPTRIPGPVFMAPDVVSVGLTARGASSGKTLVLQFVESSVDAIPDAAGSFQVTLADHAGDGSTVAFVGTPSVVAPGSLGATATLVAPNVLMVSIVASDTLNVELITISGLGISASSTAAIGSLNAELDDFTGSLATGAARNVLASPGSVIASP